VSDEPAAYLFLCGADMDPSAVLAAYPGARFVARTWVAAAAIDLPPLPDAELPPPMPGTARAPAAAVWGILLRLPAGESSVTATRAVTATTDDERRFAAAVGTAAAALADPAAVLAWARYWELPPSYVRRLAVWAEAAG
jgi:hypothetical protein